MGAAVRVIAIVAMIAVGGFVAITIGIEAWKEFTEEPTTRSTLPPVLQTTRPPAPSPFNSAQLVALGVLIDDDYRVTETGVYFAEDDVWINWDDVPSETVRELAAILGETRAELCPRISAAATDAGLTPQEFMDLMHRIGEVTTEEHDDLRVVYANLC